jgi:hypothetical protein
MNNKIEISKEGYLNILERVFENKLEERKLALERYRKADDLMDTPEQFVLMGKNAVSFLNLASLSTNDLAALAKEIKNIVYKDEIVGDVNLNLSDNWKTAIIDRIDEVESVRNSKRRESDEDDK